MTLPTDNNARKALPLWDFMFGYFADAWLAVVGVAVAGNRQHENVCKTIMWDRTKSTDQLNTAFRHQFDYGMGVKKDADGQWHLAKAIWRLSAQLQLDIEAERQVAPMTATEVRENTRDFLDRHCGSQTDAEWCADDLQRAINSIDDGVFPLHPDDEPLPTSHILGGYPRA